MPVRVETPGAMSNGTFVRASAAASVCSAPSSSGSPENSRTTAWPALRGVADDLRARGVAERQAVVVDGRLDLRGGDANERASGTTSTSATTTSASRSSAAARSVSRSGSPGPTATNATLPNGFFLARVVTALMMRFPSRD